MKKDFNHWNIQKQEINAMNSQAFFRAWDIWWCALGVNVGSEEDGKNMEHERPVLILKKFNQEIFWALPITTQKKRGKYYFNYVRDNREFAVMLSQIRLLDRKRLRRRLRRFPFTARPDLLEKFQRLLVT